MARLPRCCLTSLLLVSLALGCRDAKDAGGTADTQSKAVVAQGTAQTPARDSAARASGSMECQSQDEASAIGCAGGAASRAGDTLVIRLLNGETKRYVSDSVWLYSYEGVFVGMNARQVLHLVRMAPGPRGPEKGGKNAYLDLINGSTGDDEPNGAGEWPVPSPDRTRFFADIGDFAISTGKIAVAIWRFTGTHIEKEFEAEDDWDESNTDAPWPGRWFASEVVWASNDTITFRRIIALDDSTEWHEVKKDTTRGLIVRQGAGWAFDSATAACMKDNQHCRDRAGNKGSK